MTLQSFCLASFANEQVHVLNYPTLVSRLSLVPEFVGETGFFYYIVNFVNLSGKRNRRENINEITTTAEYFGRAYCRYFQHLTLVSEYTFGPFHLTIIPQRRLLL